MTKIVRVINGVNYYSDTDSTDLEELESEMVEIINTEADVEIIQATEDDKLIGWIGETMDHVRYTDYGKSKS